MTATVDFSKRRNRVRKLLRARDVDALLVSAEKNVAYLTGFTGDSTLLLIGRESELLVSDFRYVTQLEEECPGIETFIRPSSRSLGEALVEVVKRSRIGRLGFEEHVVTVEAFTSLKKGIEPVELVPVNREVERLRAIKDAREVAEIREAVRLAEKGFRFLKAILTPRSTERRLAHELEHAIRNFGGVGVSFPPIVAVGDRAALPHYRPGDRRVSDSPILLVDWGVETGSGYKSDLTRTLLTGRPGGRDGARFEKVYRTVLEAQQRAIEGIAPGAACSDVDAIARNHIEKAGYGEYFDHGLGHGIGLDVHEFPRLSRGSETLLQAGMVVTVEPGIYLPGWGGVRIEDDVLVTRQGREVLSSVPKDWDSVRESNSD